MATTYTVTAAPLLAYSLGKMADEANAARPLDDDGQPIGPALTAQDYLQARVNDIAQDYARRWCRISGVSAVRRFTAGEWARINALVASNPQFAAMAQPLLEGQRCEIAGPLWQQGVQHLATIPGLLDTPTADRVAALLAPPGPTEPLA